MFVRDAVSDLGIGGCLVDSDDGECQWSAGFGVKDGALVLLFNAELTDSKEDQIDGNNDVIVGFRGEEERDGRDDGAQDKERVGDFSYDEHSS